MPDVELLDLGEGGDQADVGGGRAVASVDREAALGAEGRHPAGALQLAVASLAHCPGVGVGIDLEADQPRPGLLAAVGQRSQRVDLARLGVEKPASRRRATSSPWTWRRSERRWR